MKNLIYKVSILIFTIFIIKICYSQTVNYSAYFPLKTGHIFVYYYYGYFYMDGSFEPWEYKAKIVITDTVSHNGKKYYQYTKTLKLLSGTGSFNPFMFPFNLDTPIRLDSLTGNIFYYAPGQGCSYSPNEIMLDSLNSKLNNNVYISCVPSPYWYKCIDTNNVRKYFYNQNLVYNSRLYSKNIGLLWSRHSISGSAYSIDSVYMRGSVINGIVYGDTSFSMTEIKQIGNEIPISFVLHQNYPNPFNPSTKIKFDIGPPLNPLLRKEGTVTLRIYDILGREIITLVNEQLKPGTYEIDWNADDIPSGVYFYTLQTESFKQTKKMILIK